MKKTTAEKELLTEREETTEVVKDSLTVEKSEKEAKKCLHYDENAQINRECKKDDCKCYLLSSLDCDDYTEKEVADKDEVNELPEKEAQEEKPEAEVFANTKEEKRMLSEKEAKLKTIKELEEKNIVLENEATKFESLASTKNTQPFIELKSIVKEAMKTYTDREDVKELKKKLKNFEAINSMENLFNEYEELASENRQNITANNNDIENYKKRIEEIDEKLVNFQTKLPIKTD